VLLSRSFVTALGNSESSDYSESSDSLEPKNNKSGLRL